MASTLPATLLVSRLLVISIFILSSSSLSFSQRPHTLVAPVRKDPSTLQYVTRIAQRTPPALLNLVVDLGGGFLWVDCDTNYISSTYRPVRCRSAPCSLAKSTACGDCFSPPRPGCNNNTCGVFPVNTAIGLATSGELAQDVLALNSTVDGSNPGPLVKAPNFIFSCAPAFLLQGLATSASGMAGLARSNIGLPAQLAAAFSFHRKFTLCLAPSTFADGIIFFGDVPSGFLVGTGVLDSLVYTPLLVNPICTAGVCSQGEKSVEYFIGVNSIKVNDQAVPINATLLKIDPHTGVGGTKISTVDPYTKMETSIYRAVTDAFAAALANIKTVAPVAPFELCYNASDIGGSREGPEVPRIDLVLQSPTVLWSIFGANSMVQVNDQVLCLGFVDGGVNPRTSIVIGGYQIENNLLQFDLATSRLGFSSTLFLFRTTCANFNFDSNA